MNASLTQNRATHLLVGFVTLIFLLISSLAYADAPYRWPKDKNTNGFSYFVDDPDGNIYPMSSSRGNDWYDLVNAEGEVFPIEGVGIGKNPVNHKWEIRAKNGWCTKLALHPMGDLALTPAKVLRLSALAQGSGANVRIWTSPSLDPASGNMPDPSDRTTLFEGSYRNGERVITKFPLDEAEIEHCHWVVLEVGDPNDDCDPEVTPPEDPDDGDGGLDEDPDDPEDSGGEDGIGGEDIHGPDCHCGQTYDGGDDDDDSGDDDDDDDDFEFRYEECPLLNRVYVEGDKSTGKKFIEIVNPNNFPLELSNYYLANRNDYYKFLNSNPADRGVAGSASDLTAFNAQFPEKSVIRAGATQVVAITDSDAYAAAYGKNPDYEFTPDFDGVADMRSASINTAIRGFFGTAPAPDATDRIPATSDFNPDNGTLVLFYWDQFSDKVYDCDIANWGTDASVRIDKTSISIDGPDANDIPTPYRPDTAVTDQQNISDTAHPADEPYSRKPAMTEDGETLIGGNGLFRHDETSEKMRSSWTIGGGKSGGCGFLSLAVAGSSLPSTLGFLFFLVPIPLYLRQRLKK